MAGYVNFQMVWFLLFAHPIQVTRITKVVSYRRGCTMVSYECPVGLMLSDKVAQSTSHWLADTTASLIAATAWWIPRTCVALMIDDLLQNTKAKGPRRDVAGGQRANGQLVTDLDQIRFEQSKVTRFNQPRCKYVYKRRQ